MAFIVVREWMECGEFESVDRTIIVGDSIYALIVNYLMKKEGIKCNHCLIKDFDRLYKSGSSTRWIIFGDTLCNDKEEIKKLADRDNVIIFPLVYEG